MCSWRSYGKEELMFTGIVDHTGSIVSVSEMNPTSVRLKINAAFQDLVLGESIAVDGACLTVTSFEAPCFTCELSKETLAKTVASSYQTGSKVNLERALRLGDRLGGHWVSGHIDATLMIKSKEQDGEFWRFQFTGYDRSFKRFLTNKGSVTLNGVSLTVNEVFEDGFTATLIPHTLEKTNLGSFSEGNSLNVEFDSMTKVIVGEVERIYRERNDV